MSHDTGNTSSKIYDLGSGNSPYAFSPKDTSFTVCLVMKPFDSQTGQRFSSAPHYDSGTGDKDVYSVWFIEDDNYASFSFNNGTSHTVSFTNQNTEGVRYLFMYGGGGSAVTINEPTTGIDTSITIDGTNTSSIANGTIFYNQKSHFLEYLKLEYVITSTQKANLLAFWQNKYEG